MYVNNSARVSEATEVMFYDFKKTLRHAQGIGYCLNHVANLLQEKAPGARNGKEFKYRAPTEHKTQVSENLLARKFKVEESNRKWGSESNCF